jgi:hypothetical protein
MGGVSISDINRSWKGSVVHAPRAESDMLASAGSSGTSQDSRERRPVPLAWHPNVMTLRGPLGWEVDPATGELVGRSVSSRSRPSLPQQQQHPQQQHLHQVLQLQQQRLEVPMVEALGHSVPVTRVSLAAATEAGAVPLTFGAITFSTTRRHDASEMGLPGSMVAWEATAPADDLAEITLSDFDER